MQASARGLHAPKRTADADFIAVGPERLECGGAALRKFMLCTFKLVYECRPLRIGALAESGIALLRDLPRD